MNDKPKDQSGTPGHRPREMDRRVSKLIAPPPYETREGMVTFDRRSQIDRRANWIREFALNGEQ
jgi:hypothetical protein